MEKLSVFNYSISNQAERLVINIDGAIVDAETQQIMRDWWGDETSVSFKSIRDEVNKSGNKNIDFVMNSYGGHVGDAMAIHDWIKMLMADPAYNVRTFGLGMVCSATTYVLSAGGDQSYISPNSWYMIHNVSGGVRGDVNIIENYARTMRKFNDRIVDFYVNLTGKTNKQVSDWMDAETWFTGTEAVNYGFVKNSTEEVTFTNTIAPDAFPYKNTAALAMYNSFVKTTEEPNENPLTLNNEMDIKKFTDSLVNSLKENGFLPKNEGDKTVALTEQGITNAFATAMETIDIPAMVNESVAALFKDGVPETLQNALTPVLSSSLTNALKNVPNNDDLQKITDELEKVKEDVIANANPAGPKNKEDKKEEVGNKFEHEGIQWGTPKEEE